MPAEFMSVEAMNIVGLVDTYLRWKDVNGPPRGHERYHPSAFGKCLRLMQYERYAERGYIPAEHEDHEPFLCRIFDNGHSMHDRWRGYFEGLGILRGYWQCTNPLCAGVFNDGTADPGVTAASFAQNPKHWLSRRRVYGKDQLQGCFKPDRCVCGNKHFHYEEIDVVSKELNFYGHCDIILDFSRFEPNKFSGVKQNYILENLPTKPVVVDMKTIKNSDFQEVAKGNVHEYYCTQLMIYANVLDCDYGVLIYENKDNQRTTCYRIDRHSETLFQEVRRQAKAMNEMVNVVDQNGNVQHLLPPPRPLHKDSKECKYCLYRERCHTSSIWNDPNLGRLRQEFYGSLLKEDYDH